MLLITAVVMYRLARLL